MDSNALQVIFILKMLENNPGSLSLAEEKLENTPSILANKNVMEQMNFLENAERFKY